MLADHSQLIGVLLILAGAVGYLTIYFRRTAKGDPGCGCGCGCGVPLKRAKEADGNPSKTAGDSQQFLPAENLADMAARHSRERAARAADDSADAGTGEDRQADAASEVQDTHDQS